MPTSIDLTNNPSSPMSASNDAPTPRGGSDRDSEVNVDEAMREIGRHGDDSDTDRMVVDAGAAGKIHLPPSTYVL